MPKGILFKHEILLLIFNNIALAGVGDSIGLKSSAIEGTLYIALHTTDISENAEVKQNTEEVNYVGYSRISVVRNGDVGWSVVGNCASNIEKVIFSQCTVEENIRVTTFSVGTDLSGEGKVLYIGQLLTELEINNGDTPEFAPGALQVKED